MFAVFRKQAGKSSADLEGLSRLLSPSSFQPPASAGRDLDPGRESSKKSKRRVALTEAQGR
jgi:hypothetical protein